MLPGFGSAPPKSHPPTPALVVYLSHGTCRLNTDNIVICLWDGLGGGGGALIVFVCYCLFACLQVLRLNIDALSAAEFGWLVCFNVAFTSTETIRLIRDGEIHFDFHTPPEF